MESEPKVDNVGFSIHSEPICNPKITTKIKEAIKGIWVCCNGGKRYTNEASTLDGYAEMGLFQGKGGGRLQAYYSKPG